MTIELSFGWWLLPLAITIAAYGWHRWVNKDVQYGGDYNFSALGTILTFALAACVSLTAWLVWAVLA
jgi:hypothetical protein